MDPDAKHFRYDPVFLWKLRFGLLCGFFVVGMATYVALFDPPQSMSDWRVVLGNLTGALVVSIILMRYHHLVSNTYAIDMYWVSQLRNRVLVGQFSWGQIQELRYRRLAAQLVLSTSNHEASIRVEKQLLGFDQFREMAEEFTGLKTRVVWW